ncbi:hypothetical protein BGZ65_005248 [Modicella reniformis]|uniref:Uncharacterized protein n=1 Tax=Modicella reniformis TaxID=1440133 RepID=A0A9P6IJX0_9FUNG|nr:hypothetical protein BGZ65_005248 [Modicella reniformis]
MASYKSANAFEDTLPRNATAMFTNSGATPGGDAPETSTFNSFFGSPSFPHPYSPSHALSTSVREQSLALGNLELAQSFGSNPVSPAPLSQAHDNTISSTSTAVPSSGRIDDQLQSPSKIKKNSGHRNGGDRSPPSGLSLLLKPNQKGFNGKSGSGSNHDPLPSAGPGSSKWDNKRNHNYSTMLPVEGHRQQKPLRDDDDHTKWTSRLTWQNCIATPLSFLPAVVLGLLLNLLDAVSYGMITFPLNMAPFQALGPDGISMFFLSCVVSQLVYSLGGSAFKGGNGSMMIEVVPFLHIMAETVVNRVGAEKREAVLATTILAYALSTIMTGVVFLALGYFQLGALVAFFPRHILVGCIGGVGWFLIVTAISVSSRMTTELTYTLETFKFLFLDIHVFCLWFSSLSLALILRLLQHNFRHPFIVPGFYILVPVAIYVFIAVAGFDWETLRVNGWVFPMPEGDVPGWRFYTYFNLELTDWGAILDTVPAMLALTFFGILHVPINVPALAFSTKREDIDTNRELVAHGWSNLLSGGVGSVQNYLAYTNSLLFINSGGDSRVAGMMLAMATLGVFFIGPWIVGYIPVMVVGSLIFHLGLDLIKEALWDTWGRVQHFEYATIALIVVFMAGLGFVQGIILGLLLACVIFVLINSRREGVRYSITGKSARSTVRRIYRQQKFLRKIGQQIQIFKLQGDMFFGTINKVEKEIRNVLSPQRWENHRIRYLVLDFSLVRYVDFSAAEVFRRIREALDAKEVHLVLCGLDEEGEVAKALRMVGVWGAETTVDKDHEHTAGEDPFDTPSFSGLSEALEYCENGLLKAIYLITEPSNETNCSRVVATTAIQDDNVVLSPDLESTQFFAENLQNSPRKKQIFDAANDTLHVLLLHPSPPSWSSYDGFLSSVYKRPRAFPMNLKEPMSTLMAAFHDTSENAPDFILRLRLYLEQRTVPTGTVLWKQGDAPTDGIFLVEEGMLRSTQEFHDADNPSEINDTCVIRCSTEAILPGTLSGEIGLFTGSARISTVVAETNSILWCLNQERFQQMIKENPALAVEFMRLSMSFSAERLNTMTAYAFNLS